MSGLWLHLYAGRCFTCRHLARGQSRRNSTQLTSHDDARSLSPAERLRCFCIPLLCLSPALKGSPTPATPSLSSSHSTSPSSSVDKKGSLLMPPPTEGPRSRFNCSRTRLGRCTATLGVGADIQAHALRLAPPRPNLARSRHLRTPVVRLARRCSSQSSLPQPRARPCLASDASQDGHICRCVAKYSDWLYGTTPAGAHQARDELSSHLQPCPPSRLLSCQRRCLHWRPGRQQLALVMPRSAVHSVSRGAISSFHITSQTVMPCVPDGASLRRRGGECLETAASAWTQPSAGVDRRAGEQGQSCLSHFNHAGRPSHSSRRMDTY